VTRYRRRIITGVFVTLGVLAVAVADPFDIDWWTVDGGGAGAPACSTGGDYELSGTIGQPDAGVVVMTGGTFELTGGFWAGISDPAQPGDCDADGDVDLDDFGTVAGCLSGPGGGLPPGCQCADLDGEGDVDLGDFNRFQLVFSGPGD